jgi:phenylpropionate dioxygenase-like ring-hydroxylating dioxygenase large terminal subunit
MTAQITGAAPGATRFPRYDAAVLGLEDYWYPVMFSRSLRPGKGVGLELFGNEVLFVRDGDTVYAIGDRCPHRGVPISMGMQLFPHTFTCGYHGWTFDLKSGTLVAALTDGPQSGICGKAGVATYRVAERAGIIWFYHGTGEPPPVERDIPPEMLAPDTAIEGRITVRAGDWRYGAENGFDESHGKFLHRSAVWSFFSHPPAWIRTKLSQPDWRWMQRDTTEAELFGDYPGVGAWPPKRFWKIIPNYAKVAIAVPGVLRVAFAGWIHFEWYVPTVTGRHRYLQFAVKRGSPFARLRFRLRYQLMTRWLFHGQFNDQDARMVERMRTPPEQLFAPDYSLIAWRKLCEDAIAAGGPPA